MLLKADGIGRVVGRLLLGTAEKIPPEELVDTTGAGDAFIGGVIYGTPMTNSSYARDSVGECISYKTFVA